MGTERGMALVETILLGVSLILPLVWLLGTLSQVHRAALGVSAGAREAGSAVLVAGDPAAGAAYVDQVVGAALRDHDLELDAAEVDVSFPGGAVRGGLVRVEIRYPVPMMDVPGLRGLPPVWVGARHEAVIDPYRSR